jgi:predicted transcriptional regulator
MADVNDYITGKILTDAKSALNSLKFVGIPIIGSLIGKELLKRIRKFEPKLIEMETALKLIQESKKCAIGERVCRAIHKNSELTESVFLDELAEGLAEVGKARYVTKEEAINTINKYNNPLILSKVTNKHMEICRSSPDVCVYWNMEKCGLKCLNR